MRERCITADATLQVEHGFAMLKEISILTTTVALSAPAKVLTRDSQTERGRICRFIRK
jgi:hypothetical protein